MDNPWASANHSPTAASSRNPFCNNSSSSFVFSDLNRLGDDGSPCDELRSSGQNRMDASQHPFSERPWSQSRSSEYLHSGAVICHKKGSGSCDCDFCFFADLIDCEDDAQEDIGPGDFEPSSHNHGTSTDMVRALPIRPQPEMVPQTWNQTINAFSAHSISQNALPASIGEASSTENFEKSRKRRRAPKTASPAEDLPPSLTAEQLLENLKNALDSNPSLKNADVMRNIQQLFHPSDESGSKPMESRQIQNPTRSSSALAKGKAPVRVQAITVTTSPRQPSGLRAAVNLTRDQLSPGSFQEKGQAAAGSPQQRRGVSDVLYHCTYPNCEKFWTGRCGRSDWKRHEFVHWTIELWICQHCSSHALPQGGFACNFCHVFLRHAEAIHQHILACEDAHASNKTFSRKDKLRDHVRDIHGVDNVEEHQLSWTYKPPDRWPHQCGYCGTGLSDWTRRVKHVGDEFLNGARISDWRIPFISKSRDKKPEDFGPYPDDSGDDYDDDDNDSDHGFDNSARGRIKAPSTTRNIAPRPDSHQTVASDRGWSYGSQSRTPGREDISDRVSQENGYESEAVSTDTLQLKNIAAPMLPGSLAESSTPEHRASQGVCQSSKRTSAKSERFCAAEAPKSITSEESPATYQQQPCHIDSSSDQADRLRYLFLDADEPRRPSFGTSQKISLPPPTPRTQMSKAKVTRRFSHTSTASSTSSVISSVSEEARSTVSKPGTSNATSISIARWRPPPTFVQPFPLPPFSFGYDLPCEFFFQGCELRFDPGHIEAWISHSASHFVNAPFPSIAICTFCDEAIFRSSDDSQANWRERMLHIFDHLAVFTPSDHMRPDYWVIEHMERHGLGSSEDYAHAVRGTERPRCDHLQSLEYETPEMNVRDEKGLQQPYDSRKEDRQRKGVAKKGKGIIPRSRLKYSLEVHNPNVGPPASGHKNKRTIKQSEKLDGSCIDKAEDDHCLECHLFGKCAERAEQNCCLDCQVSALLHHTQDATNPVELGISSQHENSITVDSRRWTLALHGAKESATSLASSHSQASTETKPSTVSSLDHTHCLEALSIDAEEDLLEARQIISATREFDGDPVVKPISQHSISGLHDSNAICNIESPRWGPGCSVDSLSDFRKSSASSHDSRSSREKRYCASSGSSVEYYTSSRSSMGNYGGSGVKTVEEPTERRYRVPDADKKYITSTKRGNVEVINHCQRRYDPQEPRASDAIPDDHKEAQYRPSSRNVPSHRR